MYILFDYVVWAMGYIRVMYVLALSAGAEQEGNIGSYPETHGQGYQHPDITVKILLNIYNKTVLA